MAACRPRHRFLLFALMPSALPLTRAATAARIVSAVALATTVGCGRERPADPGSVIAARTLGLAYLQTDELQKAESQFRKMIELVPGDPAGHANLALTYLRAGRLADAEAEAARARGLDSSAANIALILAAVYATQGRAADARAVLAPRVAAGDDDPPMLFALAQLDSGDSGSAGRADLLRRIIAKSPTNLAVRLSLLDAFVAAGAADSATRALEEIRRIPPEPPREALAHYAATLSLLRAGRLTEARPGLAKFRAAMELTPAYQASLDKVKGPAGPAAGQTIITFTSRIEIAQRASGIGKPVEDAVRFSDVTAAMKLPAIGAGASAGGASAIATGDFDGDGEEDLAASVWDAASGRFVLRLYKASRSDYQDVTAAWRLDVPGGAIFLAFADYDNDGRLDLLAIAADGSARLFHNVESRSFRDVTAAAHLSSAGGAATATFVDLDHDGDLDLVTVGPSGVRAYQNRGDGTFSEETAAFGMASAASGSGYAVGFADFDGDGRLDIVVSRGSAGMTLYRNAGQRRFEDATAASGLAGTGPIAAFAIGDYDNDGAFDILTVSANGDAVFRRNRGDGVFARDPRAGAAVAQLRSLRARAVSFTDYDNDGWLDVIAAGEPTAAGGGVALFRSDGRGGFTDRTELLPAGIAAATALAVVDLASDGDDDYIVASAAGGPRVIRNVGGNANPYVRVRLSALRTGSGKNNDFGIGSRIEARTGNTVQTRVVTSEYTHFGLGGHLKADVIRIEWTNGVPQVIYFPGSDQDVLENEILKGSCGFLYAWNGERYEFVTDVIWRSALGMPLGLMGSNTAWAPAGASQEYLRISGDALKAHDGRYTLQITEELWESAYVDELRLIAVDHPDSVSVHVDERFIPPGPVSRRIWNATRRRPPLSAVDERGNDVLPALKEKDDVYVSDFFPTGFQGIVATHDLIMDLGPDAGSPGTALYLRGWIYPTDASINVAISQQKQIAPIMPALEVRDASGRWRAAADIGFPSGKDKTIVVDLAGKFPTNDHHVRIRTNMQIYWDQAFVATEAPRSPLRLTDLKLAGADLHFRGTSRTYRKGGEYGPQWFDYSSVTKEPVWRPITGRYTRFGDVLPLLGDSDDMYVIMAPGDEMTLSFDAAIEPPPPGWTRDFLLYTDGWIKDADMNTAFGNTVGPLPFHAIGAYPPGPGDVYPSDPAHQKYLREYNTRVVGKR